MFAHVFVWKFAGILLAGNFFAGHFLSILTISSLLFVCYGIVLGSTCIPVLYGLCILVSETQVIPAVILIQVAKEG